MPDTPAFQSVLRHYLERLNAAISRSALLNVSPGPLGRGARIDLTHLDLYEDGLADRLLRRLLSGRHEVAVKQNWQIWDDDEDRETELTKLYRQIERKLIRDADKIERETGNRSLWLAYPLIYVANPQDREQSILAPVMLWPMKVKLDHSRQWALSISRDKTIEEPEYNRVLRAWVERRLGLKLEPPSTAPKTPEDLTDHLKQWMVALQGEELPDLSQPIKSVTQKRDISKQQRPRIFHSAVLGVMRWQNQAVMDNLEELLKLRYFEYDCFTDIVSGKDATQAHASLRVTEDDRHHVSEADYSQEQAVLMARESPGVVVHGPPGTGKSQTITNIVADALARGEKVLVVCQKRAALDVVAERLKASGLHDLFLNVHDATSDRELSIDILKAQLDSLGSADNNGTYTQRRSQLCQRIESAETKLDDLHSAYYKPRRWGLSFQQTMAKLVRLETEQVATAEDRQFGDILSSSNWADIERILHTLESAAHYFVASQPLANPWIHRLPDYHLTPESRRQVNALCHELHQAITSHDQMVDSPHPSLTIEGDPNEFHGRVEHTIQWIEKVQARPDFNSILLFTRQLKHNDEYKAGVRNALELGERLLKTSVNDHIDALTPQIDGAERTRLLALLDGALKYRDNWLPLLSGEYRQYRKLLRSQIKSWGVPYNWNSMVDLKALLVFRGEVQDLDLLLSNIEELPYSRQELPVKLSHLADHISCLRGWVVLLRDVKQLAGQTAITPQLLSIFNDGSHENLSVLLEQLCTVRDRCESFKQLDNSLSRWKSIINSTYLQDLGDQARRGIKLNILAEQLRIYFDRLDELQLYERLRRTENETTLAVLDRLEQEYSSDDDGPTLARLWRSLVSRSVLMAWWREAIQETPDVQHAHTPQFEDMRNELREAISNKTKVQAGHIANIWSEQHADCLGGPWHRILVKRGRASKRMRQIIEHGQRHGIFNLRPCWLTNPETACQIFPLVEGLFDVVVFDEASQLPIEQAAPVLYRGRRVVVAGDEHQLPPTSFFSTRIIGEDDGPEQSGPDEDADAQPIEQVLDEEGIELALGASDLLELSKQVLPSHVLKVHYRSMHPGLIEYSNWAFYKGDLEAAHPSWGVPKSELSPIRIHQINGVYDNKANHDEARYIVNMLAHIWTRDDEPPTTGIVTFNQQQERLIESQIDERAHRDHRFRSLLDAQRNRSKGDQDVGFFVKNLESVQGDERDIIIFSTTFGPTERGDHGTFRRYFGPLTQSGGERRLNVAVTRSRIGMVIVTSMPFEKISDCGGGILPDRKIKARDYLQSYMYYADAVSRADVKSINRWLDESAKLSAAKRGGRSDKKIEFDSELEEQVYQRLVDAGFKIDTQVGEAGFRIDLAVRHPDPEMGYLLGIECDGATYHSDQSARTRDVWREAILKDYGWEIYRIWSTRWWTRSDEIMADLITVLRDRVERLPYRTTRGLNGWIPNHDELLEVSPVGQKLRVIPEHEIVVAPSLESDAVKVDQKQEVSFEPLGETTTQWGEIFQRMVASSNQENDRLAQWKDGNGLVYHLCVERQRGRRVISIRQGEDIIEHCGLTGISDEMAGRLGQGLSCVDSHNAVIDWFRHLRAELFPELWQEEE